jgi:hypothetical protein
MSQLPERTQSLIKSSITICDNKIKDLQINFPSPQTEHVLLGTLFNMLIHSTRLEKLIFQAILKQNKILLPILKERYANVMVDCMTHHQEMVVKDLMTESMFYEYCDDAAAKTNLLNSLISETLEYFGVSAEELASGSESEEEEEEEEIDIQLAIEIPTGVLSQQVIEEIIDNAMQPLLDNHSIEQLADFETRLRADLQRRQQQVFTLDEALNNFRERVLNENPSITLERINENSVKRTLQLYFSTTSQNLLDQDMIMLLISLALRKVKANLQEEQEQESSSEEEEESDEEEESEDEEEEESEDEEDEEEEEDEHEEAEN